MKYLTKVISGGQTGADIAGLKTAKSLGIETGGTAPLNFLDENGINLELRDIYGLIEGPKGYPPRTMLNVDNSDGTLVIRLHKGLGTDKTIGYAQTKKWSYGKERGKSMNNGYKPVLVIDNLLEENQEQNIKKIVDFIKINKIKTLNIAGHRETTSGVENFEKKVIVLLKNAFLFMAKTNRES